MDGSGCGLHVQPTPEEDEQDDEDGDVDDVSESDNDELDTDMIDERDSADDVIMFLCNFVSFAYYCQVLPTHIVLSAMQLNSVYLIRPVSRKI